MPIGLKCDETHCDPRKALRDIVSPVIVISRNDVQKVPKPAVRVFLVICNYFGPWPFWEEISENELPYDAETSYEPLGDVLLYMA